MFNPNARPLRRQSQQVGIRSWRRIVGGVGVGQQRARCRERLEWLASSTLDCESIQREAITHLQRLVGFDRWCWPLADPKTLIPLSGVAVHDYGPMLSRALELEYSGVDFVAKDVSPAAPTWREA